MPYLPIKTLNATHTSHRIEKDEEEHNLKLLGTFFLQNSN